MTQCLTREKLKQYVTGWADPLQCDAIEAHLQACSECEQTIANLERDPDTLIAFVQESKRVQSSAIGGDQVGDGVVGYALSRAKQRLTEMAAAPQTWLPPSRFIGPYELLQQLGRGGMGSVYLARHRQLNKQVAIKLLPARTFRDDHFTARFQREIHAAGRLNHPSIVNATDAGLNQSIHFLVMEYIDGMDLSRVLRAVGSLSIADACSVMHSVSLGLAYAHAVGIVHRDIKPSNVMLSIGGQIKILDFGLAQVSLWDEASAELTTVGQLMGTLDYMAPEQAERADSVDYRADLYSIGAMLFRLLCGRAPLAVTPDLSPLAKLRLLTSHAAPSLASFRSDAPDSLVVLVEQLLARDPVARPASATHVAEQLAKFTTGADLTSLLAAAQAQATSPKDLPSDLPSDLPCKLLDGESVPFEPQPVLDEKDIPVPATQSWSNRGRRKWLIAAAGVPLLILLSIFILVETQKGQLVIELMDLESGNADVKVMQDGKVYQELHVEPGTKVTRLYAGKYEIALAPGSDNFILLNDKVELRRGDTVVARIHSKSAANERSSDKNENPSPMIADLPTPSSSALPPVANEPVYEGKPLSAWLDQFARERSSAELYKILTALNSMVDQDTSSAITKTLLTVLPRLDGKMHIGIPNVASSEVDFEGFKILRRSSGNSRAYCQLMIDELEKGNFAWSKRILAQNSYFDSGDNESMLPLVDWIFEYAFVEPNSSELASGGASTVRFALFASLFDEEREKKIIEKLTSCQKLELSFWLDTPPLPNEMYAKEFKLNSKFLRAIESKAILAIVDSNTQPTYVAQAAIILTMTHSNDFDRCGLARIDDQNLTRAIDSRLTSAAQSMDLLLTMVPVSSRLASWTSPNSKFKYPLAIGLDGKTAQELSKVGFPTELLTQMNSKDSAAFVSLELLRLASALNVIDAVKVRIDEIVAACSSNAAILSATVFAGQQAWYSRRGSSQAYFAPGTTIWVNWPQMTIMFNDNGRTFGVNGAQLSGIDPKKLQCRLLFNYACDLLTGPSRTAAIRSDVERVARALTDERFDKLDLNKDGLISPTESDGAAFSAFDRWVITGDLPAGRGALPAAPGAPREGFRSSTHSPADANKDESISTDEFYLALIAKLSE